MIETLSDSYPKARKQYKCNSIENVLAGMTIEQLMAEPWTEEERTILHKAIVIDGCKIQVGEIYHKQVNKVDGEIYTYRGKIESTKILDTHGYIDREL